MSDVPRSLQSWVSTIHTVVLTADVFQLFIKYYPTRIGKQVLKEGSALASPHKSAGRRKPQRKLKRRCWKRNGQGIIYMIRVDFLWLTSSVKSIYRSCCPFHKSFRFTFLHDAYCHEWERWRYHDELTVKEGRQAFAGALFYYFEFNCKAI